MYIGLFLSVKTALFCANIHFFNRVKNCSLQFFTIIDLDISVNSEWRLLPTLPVEF